MNDPHSVNPISEPNYDRPTVLPTGRPRPPRLGWSLDLRDPEWIEHWLPIWEWFYRYYFRVQTDGWEHMPAHDHDRVLIVGSHNGGLAAPDMFMMMYDWFRRFGTQRPVYGLMHPAVWEVNPGLSWMAAKIGAVVAHPRMAISALRQGASVLVYPGGAQDVFRPHHLRDRVCLMENYAFIKLALQEHVPIVPVVSHGAHDTLFVLTDIYPLVRYLHDQGLLPWLLGIDPTVFPIYLGLPWGLSIGPLPNIPLPLPIRTRVCPPIMFERYGRQAARDPDYVKDCYEQVRVQMQRSLDDLIGAA